MTGRLSRLLFVSVVVLALGAQCASALRAQDADPLITDRPDFTESAISVKPGSAQVELGLTWQKYSEASTIQLPELLLRYGILNRVELRFLAPNFVSGSGESGIADLGVGAKIQLTPSDSDVSFGVLLQTMLPTGEEGFTADRTEPEIIATAGYSLSPAVSIGGQVLFRSVRGGGENKVMKAATLVVGVAGSEKVGLFGEFYIEEQPFSSETEVVLHVGLTHAVSGTAQLDLHAGKGVSDDARDLFVGVGAAIRM